MSAVMIVNASVQHSSLFKKLAEQFRVRGWRQTTDMKPCLSIGQSYQSHSSLERLPSRLHLSLLRKCQLHCNRASTRADQRTSGLSPKESVRTLKDLSILSCHCDFEWQRNFPLGKFANLVTRYSSLMKAVNAFSRLQ